LFLVKIIDPRWKLPSIRGESIRIGSIRYYRSHEDPLVRDENEGGGCVSAEFDTIDADLLNKVMAYDGIQMSEGWTINANNIPIFSQRNPFNVYVYSCSYIKKLSDLNKLKKIFGRDSVYYIRDVMHFAYSVADIIKIRLSDFISNNPDLFGPGSRHKISRLNVYPMVDRVKYSNTPKDEVVNETNLDEFDPMTFSSHSHFQKTKEFENEKEVRITWTASLGGIDDEDVEFISIPCDYLDVQIEDPRFSSLPKKLKESRLVNKFGKKLSLSQKGK
tara:strand:+ start:78 stop:902 length:825 start_codon:yes stop_codon:yes gene_type:complete